VSVAAKVKAAGLLARVPLYWSFRQIGTPRLLPFSVVASVTYRCNSRCSTCRVWERQAEELTVDEWDRVFAGLGGGVYYLTFTGGEPFLRRELVDIVAAAYRRCRPAVITIPTNGLLSGAIPRQVEDMLRIAPDSKIGLNVSLDGVGPQHDAIRGVAGNWERALETYRTLKSIRHPNLTVSIHSVISRFNVDDAPAIFEGLAALEPDSYITEIAEERVELGTVGLPITPSPESYGQAIDVLVGRLHDRRFGGISKVTQAFRAQYYALVKRTLAERRQIIPCYAGWASGHIAPDGDVWTCCIRAEPVGNLRETGYDFRRVWFGERAVALRRDIHAGGCYCPMANASYTNMVLHAPTLVRAALKALR
jgi:MoaA/NifB/PqqE/SkfB family radical SAM enzyme